VPNQRLGGRDFLPPSPSIAKDNIDAMNELKSAPTKWGGGVRWSGTPFLAMHSLGEA